MKINDTIKLTTARNHQIFAFEGDSITNEIIKKGEYDANTLAFIHDVLSKIKPNISLDIGANIGNHSLVIAGLSQKLIAFEPIPFLFEALLKNLNINQLTNAKAFNVGLSTQNMHADIHVDLNGNLGSSSLTERHGDGEMLKIQLRKGDALLTEMGVEQGVDFIKIDVEGHEAQVLLGLECILQMNQPLVLLEWRTDVAITAFAQEDLFQRLFKGYTFYSVTSTFSKKAYPKTTLGYMRRLINKMFNPNWSLSAFNKNKHYSNVCFVPPKYQKLFATFRYIDGQ